MALADERGMTAGEIMMATLPDPPLPDGASWRDRFLVVLDRVWSETPPSARRNFLDAAKDVQRTTAEELLADEENATIWSLARLVFGL